MPEIPEPGELMASDPPVVPPATMDGEALEKDGYLESQYRMCRFEGTELLRRAVNEFRNRPQMEEGSDFYIYTQVRQSPSFGLWHSDSLLQGSRAGLHVCSDWASL